MSDRDWGDNYRSDNLPWDTDEPAPDLVATVGRLGLSGSAVELGCGTGANVVWLARNGFAVDAIDIAPTAIERARARVAAAGVRADLRAGDVFDRALLPAGAYDLVLDRGVFHVMDGDERPAFAARVAELLAPRGVWISFLGNADQVWEGGGPPRWSATEVASAVEGAVVVRELAATWFGEARIGELLAWRLVAARRTS
jgi:SAM-dependent methyltransferase